MAVAIPCQGAESGRLIVYLEVPASYSNEARLTIGSIVLSGDGGTVELVPRMKELSAEALAGQQVLIAESEMMEGHLDSLVFFLTTVQIQAGVAEIEPILRSAGYSVAVDIEIERNQASVLRLRWEPGLAPPDGQQFEFRLQTIHEAIPPLGSLAFVSDQNSDILFVIDRIGGVIVGALVVGDDPRGLAYSRSQQKLYVAAAGEDGIGVVDGLTLRLTRTIPLQFGDEPDRLILSPDGSSLFVLNRGSCTLAEIATWSMQEQARVNVGVGPRSLAVDVENGNIYVACEDSGEIQVFDQEGLAPLSSLTFVPSPSELVIDPRSRRLYAASASERRVFGLDLATGEDLGGQGLCGLVQGLAYNPKSRQLFAAMPTCNEVAVLRPANRLEFAPLTLGAAPGRIAFDPEYRQLLVLIPDNFSLAIFSPYRGSISAIVHMSGRPHSVVVP